MKHNVGWADIYLRIKWHLDPSSHFATTDIGKSVVIVGIIRQKPVLTHASIVFGGMLASVNYEILIQLFYIPLTTSD